ncbi:MAG: 50S ribosomal protein L35 [Thermoleophilia bacterium]|nr:50S ribosomal protein L35 [Thermoleophilia bacterium]
MPKNKTHKGAKKRIRVTGSGKLMRRHAFGSHLLTKKSPNRKRRIRRPNRVAGADAARARRLLGC